MNAQAFCGFVRGFLFALGVVLLATTFARAQSEKGTGCRDDIAEGEGYKIRDVKVKARYLPRLRNPVPSKGTDYSPVLVTQLVEDVAQALTDEGLREDEEGQTEHRLLDTVTVGKGKMSDAFGFGLKFVSSCAKEVEATECESALGAGNTKCLDVSIHAFSIRVDTGNPLANLVNIPRSNRPSFLSKVPGPLLAFNPKLGVEHDRSFGPAAAFDITTNLLDLPRNLQSEPLEASRNRLDLRSTGRRSLDNEFYETNSKLSLSRSYAGLVEQLALDGEFEADHQPEGAGEYLKNAVRLGGTVKLRPGFRLFQSAVLRGRYRWSSNRLTNASVNEATAESSFEGSALIDGRILKGNSRLALWVDVNSPERLSDRYQRVAALWGFQKEFILVPNQTIGVEFLAGAGQTWGRTPQYARFFGGNSFKNFLYETKDSPLLSDFPRGPLIRSFGSGRATAGSGLSGATAYWHTNLNVTIPVPRWSSPLVPAISIELPKKDAQGKVVLDENQDPVMEDRPLRVILKNQGESSRRVLERIFLKEGMSLEAAQAKARRELQEINGILGFIADQANIYSFKPLLMFDAARLNSPETITNRTKFAVGGGVQFTLVIAKFEAGYMRTLRPQPGDNKGNVVFRLFFQNLF
jgi:hypothetical protein